MALTAAQIVTQSCAMASTPGYTALAGQLLNAILRELCQTYDFDVARGSTTFNFNLSISSGSYPNFRPGTGPYPLPSDYLRADPGDVFWTLLGVPYPMINLSLDEMDMTVQSAGLQAYPYWYATDMSQSPPVMFVYPPPSGAFPVYVRYRRQMPDISTPESSSAVPWFPHQTYLLTRLAGELMKISDDSRWENFLGEGPSGAQGMLDRYLKLKDDKEARAESVKLDRRRFGTPFNTLRNTKVVGW